MLGGRVDMQFGSINSLLPHIHSGKLRALAVGGPRRASLLLSVPTIAEAAWRNTRQRSLAQSRCPSGDPSSRDQANLRRCRQRPKGAGGQREARRARTGAAVSTHAASSQGLPEQCQVE
ncbi:tripartite tricarboxylate transporter substrate-binding protein [Variovorax sp. J31P179]|uniref:tripartite tricarboxylate transporter substrate-binding protein n=1 Tax=Variovorax sp. J31P179 TaxID=3053508 RepID=UPI00336541DF